ncbi:disease resistance protein [Trifolium medium]|uniref:Disease resistance protein n=1 Tax=Trifolium medium TaxID=97028 RepID=A0A392M0R9_9FABA|nr:disease resistance protein [Trifolium medium]
MVVQLWIAEGLVPQPKSEKSWEKAAEEYFDELVSRSLIRQRSIDDEEVSFEMHDLINDLAMIVSSPYCIRLDEQKPHERTLLLLDCKRLSKLPKDIGKLVNLRHLDIRGTRLKYLPIQISRLENLQTLSDFVVGIQEVGLKIADLGKYPHLRGNLSISQLQNVTDPSNAFQANLEMKKQINELVLQCSNTTPSNLETQSVVLEQLRPSTSLKSLTIKGYGGNKFPNWLGSSLFGNMVCLRISQCKNCSWLPPVGQLGNLKELFIGEMRSVKSVGTEFYGSGSPSFQPFSSLETLEFHTMLEWEEWNLTGGTTTEFPRLTRLSMQSCPKLKVNIPLGQLGNLKELIIEGMESVKTLGTEFYGSGNAPLFQPFPSLETMHFENMQEWEDWKLIGGTSTEFPSLTCLSLHKCPKLKGNIPGNLPSLISLSVEYCPKLKRMTPIDLPSLSELELGKCPLLMESKYSDDSSNIIVARPSSNVFSQLMICLNSLRKMTLKYIPSLTFFPRDALPKSLQSLSIYGCENLEFPSHESFQNYISLESLKISNSCNSMTSFPLGSLPVLKSLYIAGCKNLKSIVIAEDALQHNLLYLRYIVITCCDELESFCLGGLPTPNLIDLTVYECKKLQSLPRPINVLASLQEMKIGDVPNLQSFSVDDFPTSLRELTVSNIGGILWNSTFERLNSLSVLRIWSDVIVKALMEMKVPLLPASLVSLQISSLKDIECLDGRWLQHLTSLQDFTILNAPKLKSLPEEGKLPSSLKVLRIRMCPLLEASLLRRRGKEWCKIAHIPFIVINGDMIT